jgi:hypothetical protein
MKALIATIVSAFALSAFAADAPKADVKPAAGVTAPAAPNKNDTKPVKSTAQKEHKKAEAKVEAKAPAAK